METVSSATTPLGALRSVLADAVRTRVSTAEDAAIFTDPGPRWFDDEAVVRVVHSDASMFVGGLRALLLQALHPLAMAGVAGHSGYRGDPWGRLQRTSRFIAMTTFGPAEQADALIRRVRRIHDSVRGTAPDGRPYAANDPHLLSWVHLTEIDSFLDAHRRFGSVTLSAEDQDRYVAEEALVAARIGVLDPPTSVGELRDQMRSFRGELAGTPEAQDTARYLLFTPPLPLVARPGYGLIAGAAIGTLPAWARRMLRLPPPLPVADRVVGALVGQFVTRTMRWAITAPRSR